MINFYFLNFLFCYQFRSHKYSLVSCQTFGADGHLPVLMDYKKGFIRENKAYKTSSWFEIREI